MTSLSCLLEKQNLYFWLRKRPSSIPSPKTHLWFRIAFCWPARECQHFLQGCYSLIYGSCYFCYKHNHIIIITNHISLSYIILTTIDYHFRQMLFLLWTQLQLPIFSVFDCDPFGIQILCTYRFGPCLRTAWFAEQLSVPTVKWLGFRPSDIELIDKAVLEPLSRVWIELIMNKK